MVIMMIIIVCKGLLQYLLMMIIADEILFDQFKTHCKSDNSIFISCVRCDDGFCKGNWEEEEEEEGYTAGGERMHPKVSESNDSGFKGNFQLAKQQLAIGSNKRATQQVVKECISKYLKIMMVIVMVMKVSAKAIQLVKEGISENDERVWVISSQTKTLKWV